MNHPSVVTLESRSAPRALLAGARLAAVDFPAGTRCIYPNPPLPAFSDVEGIVRSALSRPLGSEPLSARLRPGMRLTLVLAGVMAPPPARTGQDVRARIVQTIVALAAERHIDDIEIIVASGLERRLRPSELRRLVGSRIFSAFFPTRIRSHDAEDLSRLVPVGSLADGTPVELNRRVVESDLTIFVATGANPGASASVQLAAGLSSYRTLRGGSGRKEPASVQNASSPLSARRAAILAEVGGIISDQIALFSVEAALNGQRFSSKLSFLTKSDDELSDKEQAVQRAFVYGAHRLPDAVQQKLFERNGAPAEVIGAWAGDPALVSEASRAKAWEQSGVSITGQADVLVIPVPPTSAWSLQAFLNPLLAQAVGTGVFFDRYRGRPLLKPGGTLVLLHPMTDRFDHEQHVSSVDFVHTVLAETRDSAELFERHEPEFSRDPALIQMYRSSFAYHPSHPFSLWYIGESGRSHAGRVIVVGADNESIPALFGFETAPAMDDALYRARGGVPRSLDVICLKDPSLVLSDVTG